MVALIFGRPTVIPEIFDVKYPSNLDDQYITAGEYLPQPADAKPKTVFFLRNIELSRIMNDVLYILYPPQVREGASDQGPGSAANPGPDFKETISLDKRLIGWYHTLPSYLRFENRIPEDQYFQRASNILLCRWALYYAFLALFNINLGS